MLLPHLAHAIRFRGTRAEALLLVAFHGIEKVDLEEVATSLGWPVAATRTLYRKLELRGGAVPPLWNAPARRRLTVTCPHCLRPRSLAVKVIHARYRLNEEARARFTREAQVRSQLDHPNICRAFDYIEGEDADYLVIEGRVLREVVTERHLAFGAKLQIAEAIAAVLVEAHRRGIIHRDRNPENVIITKSGEVKMLDFGLARFHDVPPAPAPSEVAHDPRATANVPGDGDITAIHPGDADSDTTAAITDKHALATRWGAAIGTPRYMSPSRRAAKRARSLASTTTSPR